MKKQNSTIPKKSPNSSIFLSDEDDDIDQFRKLEEAVQQDSNSDSDMFFNPDRLKKKFPNLFNDSNDNQNISRSSSFDGNDKIINDKKQSYSDNTEQILQLTNDLHQAFRLVTQKKAELEQEQQKFIKEKKNLAREKAKYESEQIFADTEVGNSASYMLLNQKYEALKDKYKFKKAEWQKEKQQYINQINALNAKLSEFNSRKDFSPNRTNSIAHFDTSSDSDPSSEPKTSKTSFQTNIPQQNLNIQNNAIDNVFNLDNISPSMESKYTQNKAVFDELNTDLNKNISKNTDFKKLSFDGSENDSDDEQFNVIEDKNINYNANNFYSSPKSNRTLNVNPTIETREFQQTQQKQINSSPKQLTPQIPESLKSASNDSNDSVEIRKPFQFEQKEKRLTTFRNWDDYDGSSDSFLENPVENDSPQVEKLLVFRAVIPKGSQNSNNGSRIDSSPPLIKKSKNSGESSEINTRLKVQKNLNTKVQKKLSPQKNKKSKIECLQKKLSPDFEKETASNSPDQLTQNRLTSYPPLFNMNDPKNSKQKVPPATIKSNVSFEPIKVRTSNFSIFENYDVNFNVNLGDVIEEKNGPNKKKIIKYFDGSTEVIFPNGTRKVTRSNCVYVFYQNGDISQDFNDGTRAYKYSNGTIDLTLPDGIILCVFPNGQREKHFLNGDKEIVYPSGETKYLKANA